jgi:hypothetical protein
MNDSDTRRGSDQGVALLIVMALLTSSLAVLAAYYVITQSDHLSTRAFKETTSSFYAAEAGLNWRLKLIRDVLEERTLIGTPPRDSSDCGGDGDLRCETYEVGAYSTRVSVFPQGEVSSVVVPAGEPYEGRSAQQFSYRLVADSRHRNAGASSPPEARLSMTVRVRQVPLFQFAAFFDKDLEIYPGPPMVMSGSVHTNGDLYLSGNTTLRFNEPLSSAGRAYRGLKAFPGVDYGGTISVRVPTSSNPNAVIGFLNGMPGSTQLLPDDARALFKGRVRVQLPRVLLPPQRDFEPEEGSLYWDRADLRVLLNLSASPPRAEVWGPSAVDRGRTTTLNNCLSTLPTQSTVAVPSSDFIDRREGGARLQMLTVDLQGLLTCAQNRRFFESGRRVDDYTDGGLVLYFSVIGPRSKSPQSTYAVRVRNGSDVSEIVGTPVRGITVVSDQPLFTQGNINTVASIPFALMGDTINVLSDAAVNACPGIPNEAVCGKAIPTTVVAAVLAGSDTTGGAEGSSGRTGPESGGLHNFIRFHEDWSGVPHGYVGSLVSLRKPLRASGVFQSPGRGNVYNAPNREWTYNTNFNDPQKLPPLTPRFAYVQQEMFSRE